MVKSFKYRLRPTKKQENILLSHIDECRILYNQLLCARKHAWEKKKLSQRVHHCKQCGYKTDRDHNAAINILTLGLQSQAA